MNDDLWRPGRKPTPEGPVTVIDVLPWYPVIRYSDMEAMLDEMEREFLARLPRDWMRANQKRLAAGKPRLTLKQADSVLRCISGGDQVDTLFRVEIESDGSLTI